MTKNKQFLVIAMAVNLTMTSFIVCGVDIGIGETAVQAVGVGDTLYVGGDGPGNYSTIQAAIDNASGGDSVFVYKGIYHENVEAIQPSEALSLWG